MNRLLIFGLGYSGRAVAEAVSEFEIAATSRSVEAAASSYASAAPVSRHSGAEDRGGGGPFSDDIKFVPFGSAEDAIGLATHILVTVPPDAGGDPVLRRYLDVVARSPTLRWIGYLSSTVVYGDRAGAWVDEDTLPSPSQPRGQRRLDAEMAWWRLGDHRAVDIIRLGGIYGPGRSAFDDLRAGTARRLIKPGHQFGRIHRDDIGRAVVAAMRQDQNPGRRVLNLVDDVPSDSAAIVAEAARLMGVPPPPEIAFADALPAMSPMARSFWAENRKVSSQKTKQALGLRWLYPSFREGLASVWRQESGDGPI